MNNWKAKLTELKEQLPTKTATLTPIQRKPTRKEVIEQKIPVFIRVNDRIIRKTTKK